MTAKPGLEYGLVDGDGDVRSCARLIHLAFGGPLDKSEEWVRAGGLENVRVVRTGAGAVGCLMRIPMGQFFGGRSVPMVGIAGVAVAPEARGTGVARMLMRECVQEIAAEGVALSTLYASTQELYRQVGYEQAGHRFLTYVPYQDLAVDGREVSAGDAELSAVALCAADEADVRECYRVFASAYDGMLDRGEYVWKRTRQLREATYEGFGWRDAAGRLEGYVFLGHERRPSGRHHIHVSDFAFLTPRAGRRIVGLLGNFGSMMEECVLPGGPLHPLAHFMAQQRFRVEKRDFWMVRVTDLERAMAARGYPRGTRAELSLMVDDSLIQKNHGAWHVTVSEGAATVRRGGGGKAPELHVGARGLASLFAGLVTPRQCVGLGWADGHEDAIVAAGVLFGGSTPWMTDHF